MPKLSPNIQDYKQRVRDIIHSVWNANEYTKDNIDAFYSAIDEQFKQKLYSYKSEIAGRDFVIRHITHINAGLDKHSKLPLPPKFIRITRPPYFIEQQWIREGQQVSALVRYVISHWSTQTHYQPDEKFGWLLFSMIIFGGINHHQVLTAYASTLLKQGFRVDASFNWSTLAHVCYVSKGIGNDYDENDHLCATQHIIQDNVTRMWMYALQQDDIKLFDTSDIKRYLKSALDSLAPHTNINSRISLSRLCRYANYVWQQLDGVNVDMALVNVLTGKTKTVGLTQHDFQYYADTAYQPKHISNQPIDLSALIRQKVWQLHHVDARQSERKSRRKSVTEQETRRLYRRIMAGFDTPEPIKALAQIKSKTHHAMALRFIDWFIAMLQLKEALPSSIKLYGQLIGHALLHVTLNADVDDFDADDFEAVYDAVLEFKSDKSPRYRAGLLYRFHQFQQSQYDAPAANIPYLATGVKVAAQLVSPALFQQIIIALDKRLPPEEAIVFKLIYLLAYRTGMRKSEILGLSFYDVEHRYSNRPNLIVRANKLGSIKSQSARRRICISALLKQYEMNLLLDYLAVNMPAKNKLGQAVFTLSSSDLPLDAHLPLNLLKTIMEDITGVSSLDNRITFHSLRHTAVTNLALVFRADMDGINQFTDYDSEDVARICEAQHGSQAMAQLGWYGLSSMVGHLTPETSFKHYLHLGYFLASYKLYQSSQKLPVQAVLNITGLTRERINDNLLPAKTQAETYPVVRQTLGYSVELNRLSKLLYKLTNRQKKRVSVCHHHPSLNIHPVTLPDTNNQLFKSYGIGTILKFLHHIEIHNDLDKAAQEYQLDKAHATFFYENALHMTEIKTQRVQPRFFTKRVKADDRKIRLLPESLNGIHERKQLFHVYHHAQQLYATNPKQLYHFLEVVKDKVTVRDAFISFPVKEYRQMLRFLEVATQLMPQKNWLIQLPKSGKKTHTNIEELAHIFPKVNVSKRQIDSFRVGICFSEKEKSGGKQFSTMLRYITHVLGILTI